MDINLLFTLLVTVVVAIAGWFLVHHLSSNRERAAKRRDVRIQYLIEAWRRLENAVDRKDNPKYAVDLEAAISDIQLFGSRAEVELAQEFAEVLAEDKSASVDELLEALRNDLRKELRLEIVPRGIKHLRILYFNTRSKRSP